MYLDRFDFPKIKYLWKSFDQLISLKFTVDHYIILNDGTRGKMALVNLAFLAKHKNNLNLMEKFVVGKSHLMMQLWTI